MRVNKRCLILISLLKNNISFATIDYRFKNNDDFLLSSFKDAKRALQYLKFNADKFKLLKSNVALMGASAGATSSLWIGLQDDLSDKNSNDPILRESTEVSCIVGMAAAHSLNLNRWKDMANVDDCLLYTSPSPRDVEEWGIAWWA